MSRDEFLSELIRVIHTNVNEGLLETAREIEKEYGIAMPQSVYDDIGGNNLIVKVLLMNKTPLRPAPPASEDE